jgi:phenylacetate-coenzyme A ligase PaaK-like adenylate-forming protein
MGGTHVLPRILWSVAASHRTMRADRARIAERIETQLDDLLRYSYLNIPFYHRTMEANGLLPGPRPLSSESVLKLPIISKGTIAVEFASLLHLENEAVTSPRTSGTTSVPFGNIVWSHSYADKMRGVAITMNTITGIGLAPKTAKLVFESNLPAARLPWADRARNLLARPHWGHDFTLRPVYSRMHLDDPKRTARDLVRKQVDTLSGRPSLVLTLADAFEELGEMPELKSYITYGEVLSSRDRNDIVKRLGVSVREVYGSGELGALGAECKHAVIHLFSDHFYMEVIRNGERVGPGEWGELVVTALGNRAMPLIRYATGDLVLLDSDQAKCACGLTLLRASKILGRKADSLISESGALVPQRVMMDALEDSPGLREYQVIQSESRSTLVRVPERLLSSATVAEVRLVMARLLGRSIRVEVAPWRRMLDEKRNRPTVRLASE